MPCVVDLALWHVCSGHAGRGLFDSILNIFQSVSTISKTVRFLSHFIILLYGCADI
jgi:hypothetical protein